MRSNREHYISIANYRNFIERVDMGLPKVLYIGEDAEWEYEFRYLKCKWLQL